MCLPSNPFVNDTNRTAVDASFIRQSMYRYLDCCHLIWPPGERDFQQKQSQITGRLDNEARHDRWSRHFQASPLRRPLFTRKRLQFRPRSHPVRPKTRRPTHSRRRLTTASILDFSLETRKLYHRPNNQATEPATGRLGHDYRLFVSQKLYCFAVSRALHLLLSILLSISPNASLPGQEVGCPAFPVYLSTCRPVHLSIY
ncbi:unnamed protein product [Protopolystoma xenopodis]|uniref:Uncharacterized protein n=1 Tax=Protopolystoma xenopodis TaxID=117903 RepID=A0A448XLU4_9PLAT|nr:unnamed protein product [Protopolystoma xenopodis]